MPINRLVAFIVKPIATIIVGAVTAWVASHVPGVDIPNTDALIETIASSVGFLVGGYATSKGIDKWLEGWIAFEGNQAMAELAAPGVDPVVTDPHA
jgi:hypothetical protein